MSEDTPLPIGGISVSDLDGDLATVDLSVVSGTLTVTLQGAATISSGASGTAGFTLSGSEADLNATLATLVYQGNLNYSGSDTLTVVSTDSATASDADTIDITVSPVNDAPVLDSSGTMTLTTITEDDLANGGDTVADIIASAGGDRITDGDSGAAEGIAITGLTSGSGTWQYSTNGGGSWNNVGAVASNSALLLRDTDLVRQVPNGQTGTSASLTFRAWDQSSGSAGGKVNTSPSGGSSAFSTATETAAITVTAVNDAPVNSVPSAQSTNENTPLVLSSGNGNLISISDVDAVLPRCK